MRRTFCVLAGLLLVALELFGQIPRTISYQGVLCDATGKPKPDNSYQMTFRLYEAETGGTAIWTDTESLTVKRGLFNTLLGPFGSSITFDKPCWLSIQVESEAELSPRIALSSVGYSFSAVNADTADYAASIKDGTVTTAKISDGAVTGGKVASGQVVKSINALRDDVTLAAGSNVSIAPSGNTLTISASPGGGGTVTGSGSPGQVTFWTGSSSIAGDDGIFWDNSAKRLGVGTTSPSYPVHVRSSADWVVVGEATASSGETWGGVFFSPNSSTGRGVYGGGNAIGVYGTSPATSGTNYGVYGRSYSSDGTGVRGYALASSGNTRGVSGESMSGTGVGVYGSANGNGTAVFAESKGGGPALQTTGGPVLLNGNVGIGTASPSAMLHVVDGSLLLSGTTGGTPASGAGTRLMWIPARGAFRAGRINSTEWDDALVGYYSTAMGWNTTASGNGSTAMGCQTEASGLYSTAMGLSTTASGDYSTAMGYKVSTNNQRGAFIIGDLSTISGSTPVITNTITNQFMAVFEGGYTLYTSRNKGSGMYLSGGASGWSAVCDRNKKENFRPIDGEELLLRIRSMSVTEWNYKQSDPSIRYIGPVAQDFYAAFHLGGTDSLGINSISIDGVNMAAVQALEKRTAELREKTAELQQKTVELETMKAEFTEMKSRLARVEQALSVPKDFTQRVSNENGSQR